MTEGPIDVARSRPYAGAAIIFGSAASRQGSKPDSVRATCEAIGLARSTYYYQSHRKASAIELEQKIVLRLHELHDCHPDDGYRRMTLQLQSEGFHVNRKRIARLMHLHGLGARTARTHLESPRLRPLQFVPPVTTPDLTRVTGPCQVWITDVAYAHIRSALVYAAAVIDAGTCEVVGYATSQQITTRLARIALHSAVRAYKPPVGCVHHSICGSQYLTPGFYALLRQYGLVRSSRAQGSRSQQATHDGKVVDSAHQIAAVPEYGTWTDVIHRPAEFIRTLYSPERIRSLLSAL